MGILTREIKTPTAEREGFYIVKAGAPGLPNVAYFGPVKEHLQERAERWLNNHAPQTTQENEQ